MPVDSRTRVRRGAGRLKVSDPGAVKKSASAPTAGTRSPGSLGASAAPSTPSCPRGLPVFSATRPDVAARGVSPGRLSGAPGGAFGHAGRGNGRRHVFALCCLVSGAALQPFGRGAHLTMAQCRVWTSGAPDMVNGP